jgi:hypothetical protein
MREVTVLSLGAGVQSTALYLKFLRGEIPWKLDAAIFADTQEEPDAVYRHLAWLKSLNGPPILVGTAGKLGADLMHGTNSTGQRFASIPAFTTPDGGKTVGQTKRQCSKEYKTEVIGRILRREILGLRPKTAPKKGVMVRQFIGISLDEAGRAYRMERNVPAPKYIKRHFHLIDTLQTRSDCVDYLAEKVPHETPRSACVHCPYHTDYEWNKQRTTDPQGWARSVEIDNALRTTGCRANRDMKQTMYLHRSCKPLELVQLDPTPPSPRAVQLPMNFAGECEGVCGV